MNVTRKVTGKEIKSEIPKRRAGDPAILIASSDKSKTELGWKPQYNSLETIIETALNCIKRNYMDIEVFYSVLNKIIIIICSSFA